MYIYSFSKPWGCFVCICMCVFLFLLFKKKIYECFLSLEAVCVFVWSLMPVNEDSFPNCQNLKPNMMQPKTSCLETNLTWETRLKSAVRKKALVYHLQKSTVVRLGRPFTAEFSRTYFTALLFSSSFWQSTPVR